MFNGLQYPWVNACYRGYHESRSDKMYKDQVIYWVKGSVHVLFRNLHSEGERAGGEEGGNANFKTKHTEPRTQEIPSALYCTPGGEGEKREGVQISKQSTQNL